MHCARFGHHILFEHERAHVIRTKEESQLPNLESLRDPTALDVRNIVEKKPRNRLGFQVFERAGRGKMTELSVLGLKGPADEGSEAVRFVLKLSDAI